uniref:Probable RNA polymerase II nuclear localization protein SLC7A6OS n=1 Tax=Moniliophthora roreri TaxID=221103 RepID=A0A0W0G092_MONRR
MNMQLPLENYNPYTILRIKRKRNEEPLDALGMCTISIIQDRHTEKRTRGSKGVFQFAQTVEDAVWQDEEQQREMQEQISRLARGNGSEPANILPPSVAPPSPAKPLQPSDPNRRYTIVEREVTHQSQWDPARPPPVLSAKELQAQKANSDFKMYDAVLSDQRDEPAEVDPAIEKIMPLLEAYLKMENTPASTATDKSSDNDYVWDIFYHRPGVRQDWTQTNTVGTITGLPPLGDADTDSGSEDEVVDEADEDSNAEEYYKNDYPDEEDSDSNWGTDSDSDDFHEHSDHDDVVHYLDDGSDHEWRD